MSAVQFGSASAWSRRRRASAKAPMVVALYSTDRCIQRTASRRSWAGTAGAVDAGAGGAAGAGAEAEAGAAGAWAGALAGGAWAGAAHPIAATRVRMISQLPER